MSKATLMAWVQASRLPFYVATFIPLLIGWTMAMRSTGMVRPWRIILVFLGSLTVHLITNLANDYFDHLGGTDAGQAIGGSRVIQEGKITPKTMFRVIVSLYIFAFTIAFIIIFGLKLYLLTIPIFFAAFSSYFYVAPPIRYGYHGLGELFVGINMGPIMVVGTYWVITGHPGLEPFLISIPVGLMVALILYYQSLPDMKTDAAVNKNTLAVKLGKKGSFAGLIIFFILIYLSIALLITYGLLSWYGLTFLLSIPLVVKLIRIVVRTEDWVLLDQYGKYVRIIYFICGLAIVVGLF
ncbi:MAG: 1,4-dihydroxy-2-naphthoate octaprenyltransferase [Syntrophus sp. (in: bacteria)]|nr:1,4-dihydroxy-2-naphthoate octaprenyltransferase [Syntrophus sp. (in: bacteria)]